MGFDCQTLKAVSISGLYHPEANKGEAVISGWPLYKDCRKPSYQASWFNHFYYGISGDVGIGVKTPFVYGGLRTTVGLRLPDLIVGYLPLALELYVKAGAHTTLHGFNPELEPRGAVGFTLLPVYIPEWSISYAIGAEVDTHFGVSIKFAEFRIWF